MIEQTGREIITDVFDVNSTINQLDLIEILWNTASNNRMHILHNLMLNSNQDTSILNCDTYLNKFKRMKVIQKMFSDRNRMKQEISNR